MDVLGIDVAVLLFMWRAHTGLYGLPFDGRTTAISDPSPLEVSLHPPFEGRAQSGILSADLTEHIRA